VYLKPWETESRRSAKLVALEVHQGNRDWIKSGDAARQAVWEKARNQ
jgi:hypothetical protein